MKTKLLSASDDDIRYAGEILRRGGLVGMPTETVYGLAGNALTDFVAVTELKSHMFFLLFCAACCFLLCMT